MLGLFGHHHLLLTPYSATGIVALSGGFGRSGGVLSLPPVGSGVDRSERRLHRRLGRAVVAAAVLPHELGHALPAALARLPFSVTLLPEWDGSGRPLGRFDAEVDAATPSWLIRLVAVSPLLLYVSLAGVLRVAVALPRPAAVAVFLLSSYWATLSAGDLAVAANPDEVRESGRFLVSVTGWETTASDMLTVVTVLLVAVVTFG